MFSFHKPRVYRSAEGCCICRAKSSSSRFTDSRKYEQDSMKCFDLKYPRHGEICNACVLLVKRFKRLPVGSNRHWGHVVDARAGPGTKSISKHKKSRDDTENIFQNLASNNTSNSRRTQSSKSLISEKFSKIFKKSKKNKVVTAHADSHTIDPAADRLRNSVAGSQTWSDQHLSMHDSMDTDYEDITDSSAINGGGGGGGTEVTRRSNSNSNTIVQFQTQTRASAYRTSHKSATLCAGGVTAASNNINASRRKHPLKTGTKRRKFMPPIRNRTTLKLLNDNAQFYDELEWEERKSCCGKIYVCSSLAGTILLDMDNFKVCTEHQRQSKQQQKEPSATQPRQQKTIIATLPTVVQITSPTTVFAASATCPPHLPATKAVVGVAAAAINSNPTPALKKHHLFFKRQSECFPQLDLCTNNSVNTTLNKTDSSSVAATNTPVIIKSNNSANNRSTIATINTQQHQTTPSSNNESTTINIAATIPLAINTTTSISAISSSISPTSNAAGTSAHNGMLLPRHSTAKVTTISPPLPTATTANLTSNNRLLHKIRTGKIYKHSLEKTGVMPGVNGSISPTAIERIKAGDLPEVKPLMRGVSKSYVLTKPTTNGIGGSAPNNNQHPTTTPYYAPGSSPTSTCSNSSVISTASSSSSVAPKFSDNSSDSGFDENLQDRKSASPLQEDTEKKLTTRATTGNVHTMFLASGVQIQGQHQNLMLTGNEIAAKLLQNRKQQMSMLAAAAAASANSSGSLQHHYQQQQTPNNLAASRIGTATPSLKISQVTPTTISTVPIVGNSGNSNLGSHINATTTASTAQSNRSIYNNNTIQHENGVTTIVPASSLAASSQTAAMNALAPSTVTITPAPTHHMTNGGTAANAAISLTKKLTTAGLGVNLITTGSNNQSNILHTVANNATHLINHNNNTALLQQHNQQQQQQHTQQHQHLHHHHHHNTTNQKIILLKTTGPTKYCNTLGNTNSPNNTSSIKMTNAAATAKGIHASTVNTGVGKN